MARKFSPLRKGPGTAAGRPTPPAQGRGAPARKPAGRRPGGGLRSGAGAGARAGAGAGAGGKKQLDFRGINCPLPVLKLNAALMTKQLRSGDLVEVLADCPSFEADVKDWCKKQKKLLVKCFVNGNHKVAQIQL